MKDLLIKLADITINSSPIQKDIGSPKPVGTETNAENLPNRIIDVVNWIIGILGVVCVIVMIIGGIQYMISTGDPGKVKKAKDTILYGLIGLVIVILAAAIVNFVIASMVQQP